MLAQAAASGDLHQLRRGWYIGGDLWRKLWPEERHLAHVIAVAQDSDRPTPASYTSAAVLHRLPLYRLMPRRVHLTMESPGRISSGVDVMRHIEPLPADDVTVVDGIRCTTLSRTVYDLMRMLPEEAAVSVADAAERMTMLRARDGDLNARDAWRAEIAARIRAGTGARGVRQARFVADFADGRAQLPGESVSRLQLHRLGFAPPRLQVGIPGPGGRMYYVDFGMDDVNALGEFDGESKYLDEALRQGRSIEEVVLEEKQREDWIRGTTNRRLPRWGSTHIRTAGDLGRRLASFGVTPP